MSRRGVEVRTGARLHFGLFGTSGSEGSRIGGIGLMIDRPGVVVRAENSATDTVSGPEPAASRAAEFLDRLSTDPGLHRRREGRHVAIQVAAEIPPHRGFGSGTQLALAVAECVSALLEIAAPVGDTLGRGKRSAVGSTGFYRGGFIADLPETASGAAQCLLRRPVPAAWRFVIVDPAGAAGPSGSAETAGFEALPPIASACSASLRELVLARILPALEVADFKAFASGVAAFNRLVGEHFAPTQGGVYAHPLIRDLSQALADTEWPHLAQSSWGPAAAVFCENQESAEALLPFVRDRFSTADANIFIAEPMNHGAVIDTVGSA